MVYLKYNYSFIFFLFLFSIYFQFHKFNSFNGISLNNIISKNDVIKQSLNLNKIKISSEYTLTNKIKNTDIKNNSSPKIIRNTNNSNSDLSKLFLLNETNQLNIIENKSKNKLSKNLQNVNDSNLYKVYSINYKKHKKDKLEIKEKKKNNIFIKNRWIVTLKKYFTQTLIPKINDLSDFLNIKNSQILNNFISHLINVNFKDNKNLKNILQIIKSKMQNKKSNKDYYDLNYVADYGKLWFICNPLFTVMKFIYGYVHNWGISIIIITLIFRMMMYYLVKLQYYNAVKIKILNEKIKNIKKSFNINKSDKESKIAFFNKEKNKSYIKIFFLLIFQTPLFMSLYRVILESVEFRKVKFLWIDNLVSKDPYYILPVIMGISIFYFQKVSSIDRCNKLPKKIINHITPIFLIIFFSYFSSGLILHHIVSNIINIIQYKIIKKSVLKDDINKNLEKDE